LLACREGDRPERGAGDAVRDLTWDLPYGRDGSGVEADMQGFFAHMDHDGLLEMRRWRSADRACLGLIWKWLKAGGLETDGRVIHPDTGVPQGGVVAPGVARVSLHEAWDRWCAPVVTPHGRGEVLIAALRTTVGAPCGSVVMRNGFTRCSRSDGGKAHGRDHRSRPVSCASGAFLRA
jgi:retron-type reverse transcriptase